MTHFGPLFPSVEKLSHYHLLHNSDLFSTHSEIKWISSYHLQLTKRTKEQNKDIFSLAYISMAMVDLFPLH